MTSAALAARIGKGWPDILVRLGVGREYLVNRHGPCPACGGRDRFRFDNIFGRGDFYCNGCGGKDGGGGRGDGFGLLMRVHRWDFRTAFNRVREVTGMHDAPVMTTVRAAPIGSPATAQPTGRILRLLRECCPIAHCGDAVEYLANRGLWPLPEGCSLRAHASVEYFDAGQRVGRYSALIADVRDIEGELVTAHVTYLHAGKKITDREPRKLLSPMTGRVGCAVRLVPNIGDTLGVGEGIETCLAAAARTGIPTWAALNTSLLSKFDPPASLKRLVIFADRDIAGLEAAARLMERLQGRITIEMRAPKAPAKDWNDLVREHAA